MKAGGAGNAKQKKGKMTKKAKAKTWEEALEWLRGHEFELLEPQGTQGRVFLKKLNCSAAIERSDEGGVRVFAKPGNLIGGEISRLVDRGYQKFLKTSKAEVPATADHLKALHSFSEELKEALGAVSLYNESLGTVSDAYVYDRVRDRDLAEEARPARPWEKLDTGAEAKKPA